VGALGTAVAQTAKSRYFAVGSRRCGTCRSVRLGIQAPEQTGIFREELVVLQASEESADASRP